MSTNGKNDRSERARRKALQAWADDVLGAQARVRGVELDPELDDLVSTATWLARVAGGVAIGLPVAPHVAGILRRIRAAYRPRTDTEKWATAHRLVSTHAERHGMSYLQEATPEHVATCLIVSLSVNVHEAFGDTPRDEVVLLLGRYVRTGDMNRRGKKLTAAGIFVELNRLAGYPFGKTLKTNQVTNAVAKHR